MNEKVTIAGIEAEVMSEDELVEKGAMIVVLPVRLLPPLSDGYVPSIRINCSVCEQECVISKKASVPLVERGLRVVCLDCVPAVSAAHGGNRPVVTPNAAEDAKNLNDRSH